MVTRVGLRGSLLVATGRAAIGIALLIVGFALARVDRIDDFGAIARGIAIAHILAQFTDGGALAALVARSGEPSTNALRWASRSTIGRQVAARSLPLALVAAGAALAFDVPPIAAAAVFVGVAWQRAAADVLRSDGRPVGFAIVSGLAPSVLWLLFAGLALVAGVSRSASLLLLLHAAASTITALAAATAIRRSNSGTSDGGDPATRADVIAALAGRGHFFVEGLLEAAVRNVDVVLIAAVVATEDAGRYALAARLVPVAMTPLAAVNGALARRFSDLWSTGGAPALSALAQKTARLTTPVPAAMLAVALVVALIGPDGDTTTVAAVAVALLAAATVSTATGSGGLLLGICRQEALSARMSAASIAVSILALLVFGAVWGVVAGAVGFAIGIAVQNIAQAAALRREANVVSHI